MKTDPLRESAPTFLKEIARPVVPAPWMSDLFEKIGELPSELSNACQLSSPDGWRLSLLASSELGQIEFDNIDEAEELKSAIEKNQPASFRDELTIAFNSLKIYRAEIIRIGFTRGGVHKEERQSAVATIEWEAGHLNTFGRYNFFMEIGTLSVPSLSHEVKEEFTKLMPDSILFRPGEVVTGESENAESTEEKPALEAEEIEAALEDLKVTDVKHKVVQRNRSQSKRTGK